VPVRGTHYLVADNPRGPWQVAPGPFLDGDSIGRRYSGKIVKTDAGLRYLAFVHSSETQAFVGEVCDPIPVSLGRDGLLSLCLDQPAGR
jgi:beta-fructofuranosidase